MYSESMELRSVSQQTAGLPARTSVGCYKSASVLVSVHGNADVVVTPAT